MNGNPKTRQSKKVGFRVLIYKEVKIKRQHYTVQERERYQWNKNKMTPVQYRSHLLLALFLY